MASVRHHARVNAPAADVWEVVRDPAGITEWLPGVDSVEMDGDERIVSSMGMEIREACTVDDDLRHFQYTITGGPATFDSHLATVDVLEDGDSSIVVYAIHIEPADALPIMDGLAQAGVGALAERFGS